MGKLAECGDWGRSEENLAVQLSDKGDSRERLEIGSRAWMITTRTVQRTCTVPFIVLMIFIIFA